MPNSSTRRTKNSQTFVCVLLCKFTFGFTVWCFGRHSNTSLLLMVYIYPEKGCFQLCLLCVFVTSLLSLGFKDVYFRFPLQAITSKPHINVHTKKWMYKNNILPDIHVLIGRLKYLLLSSFHLGLIAGIVLLSISINLRACCMSWQYVENLYVVAFWLVLKWKWSCCFTYFVFEFCMQPWYEKKFRRKQTEWLGGRNRFLLFLLISAYSLPTVRVIYFHSDHAKFVKPWMSLFHLAKIERHSPSFQSLSEL